MLYTKTSLGCKEKTPSKKVYLFSIPRNWMFVFLEERISFCENILSIFHNTFVNFFFTIFKALLVWVTRKNYLGRMMILKKKNLPKKTFNSWCFQFYIHHVVLLNSFIIVANYYVLFYANRLFFISFIFFFFIILAYTCFSI